MSLDKIRIKTPPPGGGGYEAEITDAETGNLIENTVSVRWRTDGGKVIAYLELLVEAESISDESQAGVIEGHKGYWPL